MLCNRLLFESLSYAVQATRYERVISFLINIYIQLGTRTVIFFVSKAAKMSAEGIKREKSREKQNESSVGGRIKISFPR